MEQIQVEIRRRDCGSDRHLYLDVLEGRTAVGTSSASCGIPNLAHARVRHLRLHPANNHPVHRTP